MSKSKSFIIVDPALSYYMFAQRISAEEWEDAQKWFEDIKAVPYNSKLHAQLLKQQPKVKLQPLFDEELAKEIEEDILCSQAKELHTKRIKLLSILNAHKVKQLCAIHPNVFSLNHKPQSKVVRYNCSVLQFPKK